MTESPRTPPDGSALSPKARAVALVQGLGDDSSYDDILRELAFDRLIARGLADLGQGDLLDAAEVRQQMRAWR